MLGIGAHDQAAHRRRHGFDVFVIGADNADMGKGEGHDLPGIGRIGENLLIAGHGGVEADLAHRAAGAPKPMPSKKVPSASITPPREKAAPRGGVADCVGHGSVLGFARK